MQVQTKLLLLLYYYCNVPPILPYTPPIYRCIWFKAPHSSAAPELLSSIGVYPAPPCLLHLLLQSHPRSPGKVTPPAWPHLCMKMSWGTSSYPLQRDPYVPWFGIICDTRISFPQPGIMHILYVLLGGVVVFQEHRSGIGLSGSGLRNGPRVSSLLW